MKHRKEIGHNTAYSLYALVLIVALLVLLLSSCAREMKRLNGALDRTIDYRYAPEKFHRY